MMCNPPQKYRSAAFFLRPIVLVVLPLAVVTLGLIVPAAKAQTVINSPTGFTGVTGHTTLQNPLDGGSIYFILSQSGWTF
jgi:hypothetical protein